MGEEIFKNKGYTLETCKKAIQKMYLIYGQDNGIPDPWQFAEENVQQHVEFVKNHPGTVLENIQDGDAMFLAINFYTGVLNGDQASRGAGYAIRMENGFALTSEEEKDRERLGSEIDEIVWWMNKGFSHLKPYVGECTRMDSFSPDLISFFKPGVVF